MAKADVWMPLYIGDYLSDTMHLTTEQHGAYLLLIMHYWRTGPLMDRLSGMAAVARLPIDTFRAHWFEALSEFFELRGSFWHHTRIDREREDALSNASRRSERAQKGAQARWKDAPSNASSIPAALPEGCPSPSPSPTVEDKSSPVVEPRKRAPAKKAMPADWNPVQFETGKCVAITAQWSDAKFKEEMERFKAHHQSRANVMADWQAAWQTWVLNSNKFESERTNARGKSENSSRNRDAATAAFGDPSGWTDEAPF